MTWFSAGPVTALSEKASKVHIDGRAVLVACLENSWFAFDPYCPHGGGSLLRAEVTGQRISCPLHGWTFDLAQRGCEMHGFRGLRTYATRINQGNLEISFEATASEVAANESSIVKAG